ncbi:hypothetical protein Tco_0693651 [Tanacetum coccineum]
MPRTMGTHDDEVGSSRPKRSRQYETMEEVLLPQVHHEFLEWEGCNRDAKSRAFNINEPIYSKLYHEFYSTYEFDEVCADDELKTKKIIKFRLGGRAHNLTLLEFARRLGLYHAQELDEEGFDVYFQGGLRSDEHFNAQEHQNGYANVAWLIARWMKRKGAGNQRESMICCGRFIMKIARKARVLSDEGKLIPEAPRYLELLSRDPKEHRCRTCTREWVVWRYARERLRESLIGSLNTKIDMLGYSSTWLGYTVFHYRELTTYLVMISSSMTNIISSTHRSNSSSGGIMMMSSVEMTQVGCVTACFGSRMFLKQFP